MRKYQVTIVESVRYVYTVVAQSEEYAQEQANDRHNGIGDPAEHYVEATDYETFVLENVIPLTKRKTA